MRRRTLTALIGAIVAAVVLSIPALAGGWAVSSLDTLPQAFEAGEVYPIGFTILQHGQTPVDTPDAAIEIRSLATGDTLFFSGVSDGTPGHYIAQVSFPTTGEWEWTLIQGPFGPQELGTVAVQSPVAAVSAATSTGSGTLSLWRVVLPAAAVGLGLLFAFQLVAFRRAQRAHASASTTSEPLAAGD